MEFRDNTVSLQIVREYDMGIQKKLGAKIAPRQQVRKWRPKLRNRQKVTKRPLYIRYIINWCFSVNQNMEKHAF